MEGKRIAIVDKDGMNLLDVVESTTTPGIFGIVALNPDGTDVVLGGTGDMTKAVYDPTNVNGDAFNYNNFYNTPDLTLKQNTKISQTFYWDIAGWHRIPASVFPGEYTANQFGLLSADITQVLANNPSTGYTSLAHVMALPLVNDFAIDSSINSFISINVSTASGSITFDAEATGYKSRDHRFLDYIGVKSHADIDTELTRLANTSGTNTGDNATNSQYSGLATSKQDALGFTPENVANKATDFTTINNTLYPSIQAVNNAITNAVVGLLDYRGSYNASTNLFPATGGSGTAGAILKGDFWICSVAGILGGTSVTAGDMIIALIDTPAQTSTNWDLISHDYNYVPENVANKENSTIDTSTTKYPTVNLLKTGLDTKAPTSTTVTLTGSQIVTNKVINSSTLNITKGPYVYYSDYGIHAPFMAGNVWRVDVNNNKEIVINYLTESVVTQFSLSADGNKIAYIDDGVTPFIWIKDLITGNTTPVSTYTVTPSYLSWTPDGHIVYSTGGAGLYKVVADGTNINPGVQLDLSAFSMSLCVSPDGNYLYYINIDGLIYQINLSTWTSPTNGTAITDGLTFSALPGNSNIAIRNDGLYLLFISIIGYNVVVEKEIAVAGDGTQMTNGGNIPQTAIYSQNGSQIHYSDCTGLIYTKNRTPMNDGFATTYNANGVGDAFLVSAHHTFDKEISTLDKKYISLPIGFASFSPADGGTVYFGGHIVSVPSVSSGKFRVYVPEDGTLEKIVLNVSSGTAGTGEGWDLQYHHPSGNWLSLGIIANTNAYKTWNTDVELPMNKGGFIELRLVNPAWATNPATTVGFGQILYSY